MVPCWPGIARTSEWRVTLSSYSSLQHSGSIHLRLDPEEQAPGSRAEGITMHLGTQGWLQGDIPLGTDLEEELAGPEWEFEERKLVSEGF